MKGFLDLKGKQEMFLRDQKFERGGEYSLA
jgi:hypothetical protein